MALKFKLFGTPIEIGIDFLVMALFLASIEGATDTIPAFVGVVFASVLLHELGHAAVFEAFGSQTMIRLYWAGGMTMGLKLAPRKSMAVSFAGPAMGLVVGGMTGLAMLAAPRLQANPIAQFILWVNLGWSLFNLLPFPGLDGGSILTDLTSLIVGRPAQTLGRIVGIVVVALVVVGMVAAGQGRWAFPIAVMGVFSFARFGVISDLFVGKQQAPSVPLLMNLGRFEEAFEIARADIARRPGDPQPIIWASDALRLMTRYADAEAGYDAILKTDPRNAQALRGRAYVRRLLGRAGEADTDLGALMSLTNPQTVINRIAGLYDADRHQEGARLTSGALQSLPDAAHARVLTWLLVMFQYVLGSADEALAGVDSALRESPDSGELHEQKALILCDLGRFGEARASIERALHAAPRHPEYRQSRGIALRMGGNPQAALDDLMAAAVAGPNSARARGELAVCYVQLGRVVEASSAIETLPGYAAADPFVVYARGAMAAASGRGEEAARLIGIASARRPELGVRAKVDPVFGAAG